MTTRAMIAARLRAHANGYEVKVKDCRVWWSYNPIQDAPTAPVWPPREEA